MAGYKIKDVVVLLPGITGSQLRKNGKVVWGYSAGSIAGALVSGGDNIKAALALPSDDPKLDDLGDGVIADALMPDLHLLPGVWKIDGYDKIRKALFEAFELTEGENFYRFPYDWRRHNEVAARKLGGNCRTWLRAWRDKSGAADAKLIFVCHSMGGLIARHFIECQEGWKDTRALISFGTPYRGSINALNALSNGAKKGPLDFSDLVRQFTSIYQLLPTYKCVDVGAGDFKRVGEMTGLPNIDAKRAADALAFHRQIAAAVEANRKLAAWGKGYDLHPVVGIEQETSLSARLAGGKVIPSPEIKDRELKGDGTVPRFSAVPLELSDDKTGRMFPAAKHGSLQNVQSVIEQLIGVLSETDIDLGDFRNLSKTAAIALALEDVYPADHEVEVGLEASSDCDVTVSLHRIGEGATIASRPLTLQQGARTTATFAPPSPGAYRIAISGASVQPIEDSFVVLEGTMA